MAVKKLEVPLVGDVNEDEARIALAAKRYREGKMTLKQASDTVKLTLCPYKGPDTSEHNLQLTNFLVSGDTPVRVGDKVSVSFKLTYVGKEPVTFDDKYGVFVVAKDPDGELTKKQIQGLAADGGGNMLVSR